MHLSPSSQVSAHRGFRTLRHTSLRDEGIDLRTRYKRDAKHVRPILPVVERSWQVDGHFPDGRHDIDVHRVNDTGPLNAQRKETLIRDARVGISAPPSQHFPSPSSSPAPRPVPLPVSAQTPAPSSQESDENVPYTPTESTCSISSSVLTSTSSSPLTSHPPSSTSTPRTAPSYALEPLIIDSITRPTPEETAKIIDPAGFRYILDLPQPISKIDSAVSSLRRVVSWMSLRKYGSQASLYGQGCLD